MDLKPGDKFDDRYQSLSRLGEGGHGHSLWMGLAASHSNLKIVNRIYLLVGRALVRC